MPRLAELSGMQELVFRRARARIWAGQAGLVWLIAIIGAAIVRAESGFEGAPTLALLLAGPVMLLSGLASRLAPVAPDLRLPEGGARQLGAMKASFAWPLAALSIYGPLTLHAAVYLLLGVAQGEDFGAFDAWMALSVPLTFIPHVTMLALVIGHAEALAALRPRPVEGTSAARAWAIITAAGLLPGVVLFGIPTALVSATAAVLVPLAFAWAKRAAAREREHIIGAARRLGDVERAAWIDDASRLLGHPDTSDATKARLLFLLGRVAPRERLAAEVVAHLEATPVKFDRHRSAAVAFELAAQLGLPVPFEAARRWTSQFSVARVVALAATCLGRVPEPGAESKLRSLLDRPSAQVQIAAARGLGRIGTRRAIESLGALAGRSMTGDVRTEARRAIAAIRDRCGGAGPASLSLVHDAPAGGGELSVPKTSGELSEVA